MTLTQSEASAIYANRQGGEFRDMLWIEAVEDATGDLVGLGFWAGAESQTIEVNGEDRFYQGLGTNIDFGTLEYKTGLAVQNHTVSINGASNESRVLVRNYNFRRAYADIYFAHLDPSSGNLFGVTRQFKGRVNTAPEVIAADAGGVSLSVTLVSAMRGLTNTPNLMRSNAIQELLDGDTARRDSAITDALDDPWTG